MRCSKCEFENSLAFKFCGECAASLPAAVVASSSPQAASTAPPFHTTAPDIRVTSEQSDASTVIDGERKTVTALFADIKGSTELMEDLDPEEARAIIDPALKLMIDAAHRYDGYVVQSTGDGIFALFGAPVAHEDHPQRALYAALRLQEDLKRYSDRIRQEGRLPLQARVGVNTGEVVVRSITTGAGQTEYTPIGHTTNLASRIQLLAPIGSIAATEQVRKLCEGYLVLKPLGPTRVKGVSEPVNVYEVTGLGPLRTRLQRAVGRGLTKFVGREREMEALRHAAEQAKAGRGQIVAAMAEPGVGKSRLFHEFKAISQSDWMILEALSVSHGKASAFLPVIDLLWGYFKITADDEERTRREKVAGKIAVLDRALEDALPYLSGLLGLSDQSNQIAEVEAQTRKRRALDAIKRIILRESLNQPLIVIFEDLHWIDEESQAFLNLLADSIGTAKVLLLVNYRPEYRHEWSHKTYYTQLRLDPLGTESADEMLASLLGDGRDLAPLKRLVVEKTEGNPFFMEEMVQALYEEGALVRNGETRLTRSLDALKVPATVQAILASRIDRLPARQKDLLQTVAVIGTDFRLGLIAKLVAMSEEELEQMLAELQLGEFIYEQPAVGGVEYTFKHALTHDVAYDSVLMERRRGLHGQIGAALESLYATNLDDHVAELAHHFGRSGNPQKAVEYCAQACQQCTDRGSFAEAVAHFEAGLKLLQELPDDDRRAEIELDLRIAVRLAQWTTMGYASREAEQSSARAIALCQHPGLNWEKTWSALYGFYAIQLVRPDTHKAREIAAELIERAEKHGSARHLANAVTSLAFARMESGEFELAAEGFERGMTLWESVPKSARDGDRLALTGLIPGEFPARNHILAAWNLSGPMMES
jgi:class 3 adenylate cyclase